MALGTEFPVITTGNIFTAIDTYASTVSTQPPVNVPSNPNGAQNPPGAAYLLAPGVGQGTNGAAALYAANGAGAPLIIRYVRYNSTANPDLLAAPGPVYWTDETFTTVTGVFSEGLPAATGNLNSFAGYLCLNTAAYPGSKTGAQLATILNGNWCFIVTKGFLPAVYVPASTARGDSLVGVTGNFTLARVASGTAPTSRFLATALTAIASSVADVLVNTDPTY